MSIAVQYVSFEIWKPIHASNLGGTKLFREYSEVKFMPHIDQKLGESSLQVQTQWNVSKQGTQHCYDSDDRIL